MARTGDTPGARGVSAFLVPSDLPGVSIGAPEKKMGQRGAKVADVIFDDVPVPAANRLGAEGEGFRIAMRVLDRGRLHIAAVCVGVAERLIADRSEEHKSELQSPMRISSAVFCLKKKKYQCN